MSTYKNKQNSGYTMLEQALVLPIFLIFIFGAIDVNTALQSYNALQEGVKYSLRCVYTVDGECVDIDPATSEALYNVYEIDPSIEYFTNKYDYDGTEEFIKLPDFRVSDFNAIVLNQGHFQLHEYAYFGQRGLYSAHGLVEPTPVLVRESNFPYIYANPDGNSGDVVFRYVNDHSAVYAPLPGTTTGFNVLLENIDGKRGFTTDKYVIESPYTQAMECHRSLDFNFGDGMLHLPDPANKCGNGHPNAQNSNKDGTFIVVYVTGTAADSPSGGNVDLTILREPYMSNKELGGRKFGPKTPKSGASLVPRGLPNTEKYIDTESLLYSKYKDEFTAHNKIKVKYGKPFKFKLKLRDTGGDIQWKLIRIRIFTADTHKAQFDNGTIPCQEPIAKSQEGPIESCVLAPNSPEITETKLDTPLNLVSKQAPELIDCFEEELDQSQMTAQFNSTGEWENIYYEKDLQACPEVVKGGEINCPAIGQKGNGSNANYGVADQALPANHPNNPYEFDVVMNSAKAKAICPIDGGPMATNFAWSETDPIPVPGNHKVLWEKTNCTDPFPSSLIPSALKVYKKLDPNPGSAEFVSNDERKHYTGKKIDPKEKIQESTYNCDGFEVGALEYDEQENPELVKDSLFSGLQYQLCQAQEEETLRAEAIKLGMPTNAYFTSEHDEGTKSQLPGKPTDPCIEYWEDHGSLEIKQKLGTFTEANIPSDCEKPDYHCYIEFAGFTGPDYNGSVKPNFEKAAQEYGFKEIQAAYPRAKWDCEDEDCVNLEVNQDGSKMTSQGSIKVPMNLLLGKPLELSFSDQETWEGELAH